MERALAAVPLLGWFAGPVLMFAAQLALCLKARRAAVKCIPLCLSGCGFLYGMGEYMGLFGSYSLGDISGNELAGTIHLIAAAFAAASAAMAWLAYWLIRRGKRKRP